MTRTGLYEFIANQISSSRKYRNLASNPACSFVIGWAGECTVQYEGEAHQPEGSALARCQAAYFSRWPDGPDRLSWPGIAYFAVRPKWIRYSDFNRKPALIEEFAF